MSTVETGSFIDWMPFYCPTGIKALKEITTNYKTEFILLPNYVMGDSSKPLALILHADEIQTSASVVCSLHLAL